jgi:hypothetical protein
MTDTLSRRKAFSILGLATLGLAVTPTLLMVSDAEAQNSTQAPQTNTTTTETPKSSSKTTEAPQTVTEKPQERRTARERRQERRTARAEKRQARRTARTEKHEEHSVGSGSGTTNKPQ